MTQPPPRQPTAHPPYKQLRRPTGDRMIAGVASGIGRYFNVDPTLVRVLFAVAGIATGGLLLLTYPVIWFLMPEEPAGAPAWPHPTGPGTDTPAAPGHYPPAGATPPNWTKASDPPPAA
ncbi:PspC domain-containing protein [Polymorphospora rubra]|uniref:PspC domain-containing protein n=1 Tax=Polymorphospora rubra TaxID=338584 RepID=UPI0033C0B22F